jgi:hypothetical protein
MDKPVFQFQGTKICGLKHVGNKRSLSMAK